MPTSNSKPLQKIGSIYFQPAVRKLIFSFHDPSSFPELLQQVPMNEDSLKLLNNFVSSDVRLQQFLSELRWEVLRTSLGNMHFEDALLMKMIVINFRLLSHMFDFEYYDEIYDVLNEIEVARKEEAVRGEKLAQWAAIMGVFLQSLGTYMTAQMIEVIADPLKIYLDSIKRETSCETLRPNLKFVLTLTLNKSFMFWARKERLDLFGLMERNLEKPFVTLECIDLAVQVHHNLLLHTDYSRAFLDDPQRIEAVANNIFALDLADEKWMKNIIVLSYLKPRGLNLNYSAFLYKVNSAFYRELEEPKVDVAKINLFAQLLRRFCTNIFKNDNETLIRQVLDLNLAKLLTRALKLARSSDYRAIDLKEVLNMLSLFVIDDAIVEYFLNANVASEIFFFIKEDRLDDKGSVINAVTIMTHMLRLKSYSFSKSLKLDFLVFLLKNYEKTEEEEFKADLIELLSSIYEIKEFRKLFHDEEVVIELKYRTDITEMEDLINKELRNFKPKASPDLKKLQLGPKEDYSWTEQFPPYKIGPGEVLGLLNNDALDQIQREERLMLKNVENEYIMVDTKMKKLQEFLYDIENARLDNEGMGRVKRALEDFSDLKELVNMQQEAYAIKVKAKVADLERENAALKETVDSLKRQVYHIPSRSGGMNVFETAASNDFERESAAARPTSNSKVSIPVRNLPSSKENEATRSLLVERRPPSRQERQLGLLGQTRTLDSTNERQFGGGFLPSISSSKEQATFDERGFSGDRPVSRDRQYRFEKIENIPGMAENPKAQLAPPKKYPPLGKSQFNHDARSPGSPSKASEARFPQNPPTISKGALKDSAGQPTVFVSGLAPEAPDATDHSFLRTRIEILEKKLNDSMNMLSVSNKKEIDLMIENRKLRSKVDNEKLGKEEPIIPVTNERWERDQFSFHDGEQSEPRVPKYQPTKKREAQEIK